MSQGVAIVGLAAILAAAAEVPQPRSPAEGSGMLLVESEPGGASVYVDGRLAGETPLRLRGIVAGVHRVRIVRLGYLENSRIVTIKADTPATLRVRLTNPASQAPNTTALRIVVLQGEGAVNVVQQKTAVAPVVEVRDRNDQPVGGAVVNFVVRNGRATFAGARTVTVTTDAAGRAAATGFAPTGSGALQIGATATFQGHTTAAVTIAQTNAMTVTEAAATMSSASQDASGVGAGGGGGGGISKTMLAVVGGAAVAGGLVAKKFLFGSTVFRVDNVPGTLTLTLTGSAGGPPCTLLERYNLGMTIRLNETEGNLSGTSAVFGEVFANGGTCGFPNWSNIGAKQGELRTGQIGRVTGSPENLVVTLTEAGPFSDGSGESQDDFTFRGVLSGDEIRGVLTLARRLTFRGAGPPGSAVGTNNYNIVLRKE